MARAASRPAHRALSGLAITLALALAGCGGGDGGSQSDVDAVAETLTSAAKAVADRDGDRACSHLTPDGQRQAILQFGGGAQLGNVDCGTFVNRSTVFLTPLDRERIENLQAANVTVNGTSASGTLATPAGGPPGQPMSVSFNLQKVGGDWKISGFTDVQGAPGG